MVGRNHLIAGVSSLAAVSSTVIWCRDNCETEIVSKVADSLITKVQNTVFVIKDWPIYVTIGLGFLLFFIGTLLPDIDNENSMLGRFIHIPIQHRTWTHTLWVVCVLGIISYFVPVLWWLTIGYTLHLFWDSFSACGVCWLYPITKYIGYESGAKVKKLHYVKFYWAGKVSENVFTFVVSAMCIALTVYIWFFAK